MTFFRTAALTTPNGIIDITSFSYVAGEAYQVVLTVPEHRKAAEFYTVQVWDDPTGELLNVPASLTRIRLVGGSQVSFSISSTEIKGQKT